MDSAGFEDQLQKTIQRLQAKSPFLFIKDMGNGTYRLLRKTDQAMKLTSVK